MSGATMTARRSRPASTPEAPVLRRTRRRLIAWSAGSTFVVLVVLGVAIYAAAASSLAATGEAQLEARAVEMTNVAFRAQLAGAGERMLTVTNDPSQPGVVIGGATSGTIGFVVNQQLAPEMPFGNGVAVPGPGLVEAFRPDELTMAAIAEGQRVIVETTIGNAPVRVLAQPIETPAGRLVAFVMADRTAELDTLRTLLLVLLGGGLAVLAASVAVGYVYAGRALVPIRESLERQREFAADASHELRTPLAITRAAIAELRRGRDDPATVDRAIDDLDAGAARMEHLVADLLLLARTDAEAVELAMADTDLANAAAEATESLEPVAAQRGVRLVLEVVPAPVRGDEARLRQLAAILVDNAIRHSPVGWPRDGDGRARGVAERRGRGTGHRSGAPGPGVRAVLAGAGRADRRDRPGPRDRALDRRAPRGHDPGVEPRRRAARRAVHGPPPRRLRPDARATLPAMPDTFPDRPSRHVRSSDGTPIAVFSAGSGPALILVHGTTADHRTWRVLGPMLAPRHAIHAIDRRGRGDSGDGDGAVLDRARAGRPRRRCRRARRGDRRTRSTCWVTRWAGGSPSARHSGRRRSGG